jgi:hypothetical protein
MRPLSLLILGLTTAVQAQIDFDGKTLFQIVESESRGHSHHHAHARSNGGSHPGATTSRTTVWNWTSILRYVLSMVRSRIISPHWTELTEVVFDLSTSLTVTQVLHHGDALPFVHESDLLTVGLPSALAAGQQDSLSISYGGIPPETGFGSFVQTTHAGAPIIWTLSEPYGARAIGGLVSKTSTTRSIPWT